MQNSNTCLVNKKCIPCHGGIPPLITEVITKLLKELGSGWSLNKAGHLYKKYEFEDFAKPMKLANSIADLADEEGHHPDLTITWGTCAVEIWTHKINGLTESDFILAAKIEKIHKQV